MTARADGRDEPHNTEDDAAALVRALRAGDESVLLQVLDTYHAPLVRFASIYLDAADTQAVTHQLWLELAGTVFDFDGREAFNVWLYRLLLERIRARLSRRAGGVLRRLGLRRGVAPIPYARSWFLARAELVAAVDPSRFLPRGHEGAGGWAEPPAPWPVDPSSAALNREWLLRAVGRLPHAEREVITLRDIEGWSAAQVCRFLGITEINQRSLLHRGRSAVRRSIEQHVAGQSSDE